MRTPTGPARARIPGPGRMPAPRPTARPAYPITSSYQDGCPGKVSRMEGVPVVLENERLLSCRYVGMQGGCNAVAVSLAFTASINDEQLSKTKEEGGPPRTPPLQLSAKTQTRPYLSTYLCIDKRDINN